MAFGEVVVKDCILIQIVPWSSPGENGKPARSGQRFEFVTLGATIKIMDAAVVADVGIGDRCNIYGTLEQKASGKYTIDQPVYQRVEVVQRANAKPAKSTAA